MEDFTRVVIATLQDGEVNLGRVLILMMYTRLRETQDPANGSEYWHILYRTIVSRCLSSIRDCIKATHQHHG